MTANSPSRTSDQDGEAVNNTDRDRISGRSRWPLWRDLRLLWRATEGATWGQLWRFVRALRERR